MGDRRLLRLFIVSLLTLAGQPALAGDTAELEILGFSADGSIFAFEEYGIQDGSGFPYAHRFYIDTASDSFLAGTPVRVRLDDEAASLAAARDQARKQGSSIIEDRILSENKGITAGFNAVSELTADPHRMVVSPRPIFPSIDDPLELRIEEIPLSAPELCENLTERHVGFRLMRIGRAPDETIELLHEDQAVPDSRGCPTGYRIGAIQTFFPENGESVYAVLVTVQRLGFEGPDHRWIAIPGRL